MDNLIKRMRICCQQQFAACHALNCQPNPFAPLSPFHHTNPSFSHFTHISFREHSNFIRLPKSCWNAQLQNKSVAYVNLVGGGTR